MRPFSVRRLKFLFLLTASSAFTQAHPAVQTPASAHLQAVEGTYTGTLQAGEAQLHLVFCPINNGS